VLQAGRLQHQVGCRADDRRHGVGRKHVRYVTFEQTCRRVDFELEGMETS
jgi:hypothetical protein